MLLDLVCLLVALWLAFYLRNSDEEIYRALVPSYKTVAIAITLVHVCIAIFGSSYKNILRRNLPHEMLAVIQHLFFVLVVLLAFIFFGGNEILLSRAAVVYLAIFAFCFMCIERTLWKRFVRKNLIRNSRRMVLVSNRKGSERILNRINGRMLDAKVCGIFLTKRHDEVQSICDVPVLGAIDDLVPYLESHAADEILFSIPKGTKLPQDLIRNIRLMGLTVHLEIRAMEELAGAKMMEDFFGMTVVTSYTKLVTSGQMLLKRILDILGGIVGLIFTGLISIVVIPAIYISDPGPVFFSQERVGLNGRIFRIYKFRSMYQDAEERKKELMEKNEMSGFMFKLDADPRIIGSGPDGTKKGIGHIIRAASLDEFPQFWNVLKGDMSLVGTRPPTIDEWQQYDLHHRARLAVKPGITGLWQVSGRSDISDFEEVVKLDTEYIENWSFGLDLKILFKTVAVVLTRKGSK